MRQLEEMKKLLELLEDDYEDFENVKKSSYVLGSELWESKFNGLIQGHWSGHSLTTF